MHWNYNLPVMKEGTEGQLGRDIPKSLSLEHKSLCL